MKPAGKGLPSAAIAPLPSFPVSPFSPFDP